MSGVNKVILVGNLGADPDMRSTAEGKAVTTIRLATSEHWTDRDGNKQEKTEWHRVIVWGKQAESCNTYLSKGKKIYVEGKLGTREWTDNEGIKRYTTEIVAALVVFLSERGQGQSSGNQQGGGQQSGQRRGNFAPPETATNNDNDRW